jgi:hypothetical protein
MREFEFYTGLILLGIGMWLAISHWLEVYGFTNSKREDCE